MPPALACLRRRIVRASFADPFQGAENLEPPCAGHSAQSAVGGNSTTSRWGKNNPYPGRVVAIEGLCNISSTDDKDTVQYLLGFARPCDCSISQPPYYSCPLGTPFKN